MSEPVRQFVRVGEEVRGPYDVAQLRQLAEVGVVSAATPAAPAVGGPWSTLGEHPARAEIFPTRARLGFKAVEAVRTEPPVERPEGVAAMIAAAAVPGKILKAPPPPMTPTEPPPARTLNEVEEMVRAVQAIEARFTPPPVPRPWRPSGRLKLCAALALLANGAILAIPLIYGGWDDWWSMLVVRGWFVIGNGGLLFAYFQLPKD